MAAYDDEAEAFDSVTKLGTGFNDEMLAKLPETLKPYLSSKKPARVNSKMEPDFWFEPKVVLEVSGAEITLSPIHTCGFEAVRKDSGFAIRFPRFTGRFRDDKGPEDATTAREIGEMYERQKKRVQS